MASKKAKKGKHAGRQATGASSKSVSSTVVRQPLEQNQLHSGTGPVLEAKSLYEGGKIVEALRLCLAILQEQGPNPEILELAGRAAYANGQTAAAISLLEKALALDAKRVPTLELLLEVAGEAGDKDRVKRIAQELSRLRSGDGQSSVDSDEEEALPAAELAVKTEKSEQVPEVLTKIFGLTSRLRVVDIGSNPIDGTPPYADLLKAGAVDLVGFEPQRDALAKLNKTKGPYETYYPYAVGDGKPATLYLCRASDMTSTLKPNFALLNHFHGYPQWAEVVGTETVQTVRLDNLEEIGSIDWLKIDIQGGELRVFEHGERRLADTLVIQTEVNFVPLYEGQPLFADIDAWMRAHGFMLHALLEQRKRLYAPLQVNNQIHNGLNQLTTADAVYVPNVENLTKLSAGQLSKLAAILSFAYGSYDLALRVLMIRDLSSEGDHAKRYLVSLGVSQEAADAELEKEKESLAQGLIEATKSLHDSKCAGQHILVSDQGFSKDERGLTAGRVAASSTWLRRLLICEPSRGRGNFGVLNQHTHMLRQAAQEQGLEVQVVGDEAGALISALKEAADRKDTAVYAGAFFYDMEIKGHQTVNGNIFDALGLPVIGYLGDHPYSLFMWDRVERCARGTVMVSSSQSLVQEFNILKGGKWPALAALPPHPALVQPRAPLASWQERDIDLLIPWGLHKIMTNGAALSAQARKQLERSSATPKRDADILRRLSSLVDQDPNKNLLECFLETYRNVTGQAFMPETPWSEENRRWFALLSSLDQEIRLKRRSEMLDQLGDLPDDWRIVVTAPKEVRQFSGGLAGKRNVTWCGVVSVEQLNGLYARSRRVLNCNPSFTDQVHERVRNAMAWGCLVVSDANHALEKHFQGASGLRLVERSGNGVVDTLLRDLNRQEEEAAEAAREVAIRCSAGSYYGSLFELLESRGRRR